MALSVRSFRGLLSGSVGRTLGNGRSKHAGSSDSGRTVSNHFICNVGNVRGLFNMYRGATRRCGGAVLGSTVERGSHGVMISMSGTLRLFTRDGGSEEEYGR